MPSEDNQQPPKRKRTRLQEKIHKHLNDKNDRISDEDIRDVEVGASDEQSPLEDGETLSEKINDKEKELPKDKQVTPWDTQGD